MKILIVDDNKQSRIILDRFLAEKGTIHTAADGDEALAYFKQSVQEKHYYDLFFLDIMLNGIDGHTLLKKLKNFVKKYYPDPEKRKFVLVTALADSLNIIQGFKEGCDSYLVKPVTREKLSEVMHRLGISPEEAEQQDH